MSSFIVAAAKSARLGVTNQVQPDSDGVVHLPAGTSVDAISVDGNNILLQQPDGSFFMIEGGALSVPTIVTGDVEIPKHVLSAVLHEGSVEPTAAPPVGGGGAGGVAAFNSGSVGEKLVVRELLDDSSETFSSLAPLTSTSNAPLTSTSNAPLSRSVIHTGEAAHGSALQNALPSVSEDQDGGGGSTVPGKSGGTDDTRPVRSGWQNEGIGGMPGSSSGEHSEIEITSLLYDLEFPTLIPNTTPIVTGDLEFPKSTPFILYPLHTLDGRLYGNDALKPSSPSGDISSVSGEHPTRQPRSSSPDEGIGGMPGSSSGEHSEIEITSLLYDLEFPTLIPNTTPIVTGDLEFPKSTPFILYPLHTLDGRLYGNDALKPSSPSGDISSVSGEHPTRQPRSSSPDEGIGGMPGSASGEHSKIGALSSGDIGSYIQDLGGLGYDVRVLDTQGAESPCTGLTVITAYKLVPTDIQDVSGPHDNRASKGLQYVEGEGIQGGLSVTHALGDVPDVIRTSIAFTLGEDNISVEVHTGVKQQFPELLSLKPNVDMKVIYTHDDQPVLLITTELDNNNTGSGERISGASSAKYWRSDVTVTEDNIRVIMDAHHNLLLLDNSRVSGPSVSGLTVPLSPQDSAGSIHYEPSVATWMGGSDYLASLPPEDADTLSHLLM